MRHDPFLGSTSPALALLRRAIGLRRPTPGRGGAARIPAPRREATTARLPLRGDPDASRSLTERHLRVLGVGAPPDAREAWLPDSLLRRP